MAKSNIRNFNPNNFARLEGDMWVAYYNHRFFSLFVLLLRLNYSHFRPDPFATVRGAYYSAMAAVVFRRTKGNENNEKILKYLVRFYRLLSRHNTEAFDYREAAELELQWWLVDRYPERYKISRATALSEAMAVVYSVPVEKLKVYGEKRAAAMELLGDYHHDTNAKVDWDRLKKLLQEAFQALHKEVYSAARKQSTR